VTPVLPIPKLEPGSAVAWTVTVPELSVAVGAVQETTALVAPGAACTETSLGQLLMVGGMLSVAVSPTLMKKVHWA